MPPPGGYNTTSAAEGVTTKTRTSKTSTVASASVTVKPSGTDVPVTGDAGKGVIGGLWGMVVGVVAIGAALL